MDEHWASGNITTDHFKTNLFAVSTTLKKCYEWVHFTLEDRKLLTKYFEQVEGEKDKKIRLTLSLTLFPIPWFFSTKIYADILKKIFKILEQKQKWVVTEVTNKEKGKVLTFRVFRENFRSIAINDVFLQLL